jgi:hypothetical protein
MADANPARRDRSTARTARPERPASAARRNTGRSNSRGATARPTPTGPSAASRRPAARSATVATARRSTTASAGTAGSETPTPATVWAAGPDPIDALAVWPTPLIERIATAFSAPGDTVVLLPWPAPSTLAGAVSGEGVVGAGGVIDHAPGELASTELAAALDTLAGLDRTARVAHLDPRTLARASASRPFWADLIDHDVEHRSDSSSDRSIHRRADRDIDGATGPLRTRPATRRSPSLDEENGLVGANGTGKDALAPGTADVVITSLPMNPDEDADLSADAEALTVAGRDLIAPAAARLLRAGGLLVVLTHSDWSRGWLLDPTGPVVAAAQNADLLYLQHIVALHTPIRDGELLTPPDDDTAAAQYARTAHRAQVRGLPAPHRRTASDLLVFAQPADHQRAPQPPATAAREGGVIR